MNSPSIPSTLDYYSKIRKRTLKIVETIPEDRLPYQLTKGKFSLGDLSRHIALIERDLYLPCLKNESPSYKGCGSEHAESKEQIIELFENVSASFQETLRQQSDDFLAEKCKIPGGLMSRWKWLRLMFEHEIHHRGQIYLVLSHLGVKVPNIFNLSSEDLIALTE